MAQNTAPEEITPTQRIQELCSIDHDVAALLTSARKSLTLLSGQSDAALDSTDSVNDQEPDAAVFDLDAASKSFEEHTDNYFKTVQSVCARLRRQVYALEEAGVIAAERPAAERAGGADGGGPRASEPAAPITNGGLGNFDVSWLNSRRDDVRMRGEAELVREKRKRLEALERKYYSRPEQNDGMQIDEKEG